MEKHTQHRRNLQGYEEDSQCGNNSLSVYSFFSHKKKRKDVRE